MSRWAMTAQRLSSPAEGAATGSLDDGERCGRSAAGAACPGSPSFPNSLEWHEAEVG